MVKLKVVAVLSAFFILSEATVTVDVISDSLLSDTIECGHENVISCKVSPFPGAGGYMAWNKNSLSLTNCYDASNDDCTPTFVDHYHFTSKLLDETFNLTFKTVKFSDNSVEFTCTDTLATASVTPNVTVLPVISSTELVNTSANVIKVTTGCVYPPDAVKFKWMFYAEDEVEANAKDYDGSYSVMTEDSSTCTVGVCGGSDVKLRSSTLELENTEKGGSYNFKVVITHAASSETVTKTIGPFELGATKPPDDCTWRKLKCWPCWWIAIFGILLYIVVSILIGIILGCFLIKTTCCCDCFYEGESCKDCANNYYCKCECCDKTPCGALCNIKGLPYWYQVLWATILGSAVAFGIWLVWRCCNNGRSNQPRGLDQPENGQPLQGNPV